MIGKESVVQEGGPEFRSSTHTEVGHRARVCDPHVMGGRWTDTDP